MEQVKFKVGDRVRVLVGSKWVDEGQIGTVREIDAAPWVHFDEPTHGKFSVDDLKIPTGYAAAVNQDNLKLVDSVSDDELQAALLRHIKAQRVHNAALEAKETAEIEALVAQREYGELLRKAIYEE